MVKFARPLKVFFFVRYLLPALLLIISNISLSRAEMLTYHDAVKNTLNNSARIRVKIEEINISNATYRQNFAGLYPEITANSRFEKYENLDKNNNQGIKSISNEIIGGETNAWRSSMYLWGQYYLSHWYKKRFEVGYYEKLKDASYYDCDIETKKLLLELTDAYSAAAEGKIKIGYAEKTLKLLQSILNLKENAFAGGQTAYEDVLKAEAEIADTKRQISSLKKELNENLERLRSYIGMDYSNELEFELLASDSRMQIVSFTKLIENTPEYKARMVELEALRLKEKADANNYLPDISLYGRYDYYGNDPDNLEGSMRDIRETSYSAGILISLPLFDGGVRNWERKKSIFELRRQEETIKAVIEEKGRDIKTLYAGYVELSKSLEHYKKLYDRYSKILDITKMANGFGERSMIDIMEVEKDALAVLRDLKIAQHAVAIYEKRLALETDYKQFISEYYGNRAYKY
ncbi:MAG: TolC family protein [Proteobacteria bacterium]|nr:TolC family protein [Pseudomonadota bacterium]